MKEESHVLVVSFTLSSLTACESSRECIQTYDIFKKTKLTALIIISTQTGDGEVPETWCHHLLWVHLL